MKHEFTSFLCEQCHTEIEASPDLIGQEAECPACGRKLIVPDQVVADNVPRHDATDDLTHTQLIKSRTIRIELGDL